MHNTFPGSFGDVFAVTKQATNKTWAMKRLVARRQIRDDVSAMGEIRTLLDLEHPNIIAVEEVLLCERMACIVMELAR